MKSLRVHAERSWRLVQQAPLLTLGLSVCLHVSFVASVILLGFMATPWFGCELIGQQIASLQGVAVRRHRGWWLAGGVLLGLQVLVLAGVTFAWIGLSTSAPLQDASSSEQSVALRPLMVFVGALLAALGVSVPLTFVPHHLLTQPTSLWLALGRSLEDVRRTGFWSVYGTVLWIQLAQLLPFLGAAMIATNVWGRAAVPVSVLCVVPLQIVILPWAQGVISSLFVHLRSSAPREVTRVSPVELLALVLPVSLCLLSVGSLLQPAPLASSPLFRGAEVFDSRTDGTTFMANDADLSVALRDGRLWLETSDGGGAGPCGAGVTMFTLEERVHSFVANLETHRGPRSLHFNRAGVRLDDGLSDRLAGRVPEWFFVMLLIAMVLGTVSVYRRRGRFWNVLLIGYDLAVAGMALAL